MLSEGVCTNSQIHSARDSANSVRTALGIWRAVPLWTENTYSKDSGNGFLTGWYCSDCRLPSIVAERELNKPWLTLPLQIGQPRLDTNTLHWSQIERWCRRKNSSGGDWPAAKWTLFTCTMSNCLRIQPGASKEAAGHWWPHWLLNFWFLALFNLTCMCRWWVRGIKNCGFSLFFKIN